MFLLSMAGRHSNGGMNQKHGLLISTASLALLLAGAGLAQTPTPSVPPATVPPSAVPPAAMPPAAMPGPEGANRAPTLPGPPPGDTIVVTLPFTEDFESDAINTRVWDMRVNGGATIAVARNNAAHGKNSLLAHYPAGERGAYAFIAARLPAAVRDHLYGRAYVYIKALPPGHTVFLNAGTRGFPISNFLEIGQSRGQFMPSFQLNGPGPDRGETTAHQGDIPMGRWFCLEWEFSDKPDRIIEWIDGVQSVDQSFAYKTVNSELVKGFAEFDIGFRAWGPATAVTSDIDVYYDDVAISDRRIGALTPVAGAAK
jgi:hypothetical protein